MPHKVFICYSSHDKPTADAAVAALESHRIPCWIAPRDILAGDEWGDAIITALDQCQVVLLIFSLNANDSPQVRREIERAVSKQKILVPFRIEDVLPTHSMEYALSNTHWLDALNPPLEHRLTELTETITRVLNRDASPNPGTDSNPAAASLVDTKPLFTAPTPITQPSKPAFRPLAFWRKSSWPLRTAFILIPLLLIYGTLHFLHEDPIASALFHIAYSHFKSANSLRPIDITMGKTACALGSGEACAAAALVYDNGINVTANQATAAAYAEQACNAGLGDYCALAADFYHNDPSLKDIYHAFDLYKKGCEAGSFSACKSLGDAYLNNDGTLSDINLAIAAYQKACDGKDIASCNTLGDIYADGRGVPTDIAKAKPLYATACNNGDGNLDACHHLNLLNTQGHRTSVASSNINDLDKQTTADDNNHDFISAATLEERACALYDSTACTALGNAYLYGSGVKANPQTAAALFKLGCNEGDGSGCINLGALYQSGNGIPQDATLANSFEQKGKQMLAAVINQQRSACDKGNAQACNNLAYEYLYGVGVPQDKDRYKALLQNACLLGKRDDCNTN